MEMVERVARVERRLKGFQESVAITPSVVARLALGQQFNAYDSASNDDADADEDCLMLVCLGPITDCIRIATVEGRALANMIADALTLASLTPPLPTVSV